jgi:RHS repeat-associated protein
VFGGATYDLDGAGNRTQVVNSGGADHGLYTMSAAAPEPADRPMNQYTTTPSGERVYNKNGDLTARNAGVSSLGSFWHDYKGQLVSYSSLSQTASYAYDALGRRVRRTVNGTTTRYYHCGFRVVEEQNASGNTLATYVYGNYIDEVIQMRRGGAERYYHTDDMFNVVALTGADGAVLERYDYADYGTPFFYTPAGTITPAGSSLYQNPYLFNGRNYDHETALYYYRTRYLDPVAGRFITRDTIGVWGDEWNLGNGYAYVHNSPHT